MKTQAQVVVIGGGVVGASVLYHLTLAGWTDVMMVERRELTHGSTWHSAGGMHTLNGDPNVAALQRYTVDLYLYECHISSGEPSPRAVHAFEWVGSADFDRYPFTPADEANMTKLLGMDTKG